MSQRGDGRWPVGSAGHIAFVAATLSFEGNQELGANARAVATLPCSRGVWEDKGVTPTAPSTGPAWSEPFQPQEEAEAFHLPGPQIKQLSFREANRHSRSCAARKQPDGSRTELPKHPTRPSLVLPAKLTDGPAVCSPGGRAI